MYSVKCILSALVVAALTCVTAHAVVTTGGGSGVNPNPEYDTYVAQAASGTADTWEITLPNNAYHVTIACGDPSTATGPHYVALAGDGSTYSQITALNVSTAANVYATATNVDVDVTAGKLSLKLGGNSAANRINFIVISETTLPVSTICASTSYSRNQSQDWWYYQSYNPGTATYTPLLNTPNYRWSTTGGTSGSVYPYVWINGGYPGVSNGLWAAKTWKAPIASTNGPITIAGWVTKSSMGGDGVRALIVKNTDIETPLWEKTIAQDDPAYYAFNVSVSVVAGDEIHLLLDPLSGGLYDSCQLNAIIYDSTRGATESLSGNYSRDQGGDKHITYESYNPGTGVYTQLLNTANYRWSTTGGTAGSVYPYVWINGGYPGVSNGLQAVRTWLAPSTGTVDVTGTVTKSTMGGDGVRVLIVKDTDYSSPLWQQTIGGLDSSYYTFSVPNIAVTAGVTKLHFQIDPLSGGLYDSCQLDAVLSYQ